MAYSLLPELDTNRDDWTVRVRVCRMWEFINFKRSRELISLDVILMDEKEHVSASLENFGDPQEDSDGSNCHKKQSAAKKKLLVKNNKKTETTSGDNLEEDSHDDDGFKGWKRRASSRKITKKEDSSLEDE
ncbi:hypothetical protein HAX54_004380 [Datura stramonium]|uniref:Uncharacterized protein n=1 Tax=Datura stramonium TaxID=4076 RepID=A0ABS8WWK3_DATST|nr:hypothetical protein [Datura stramonium]